MRKWFKKYEEAAPFLAVLIVLAITFLFNPSSFMYLTYFALVALTAVYAYATLRVVRATSKQTEETKRMIEEMRQSRLDAVKPALSLQPEGFTFGGDFSLYLRNSGGVAKEVRIDIEVTNPSSKNILYVPALNEEHIIRLPLETTKEIYEAGGLVKVVVSFKDSYNQSLSETLLMDFANLKEEGRDVIGQYSELHEISEALEDIKHEVSGFKKGY